MALHSTFYTKDCLVLNYFTFVKNNVSVEGTDTDSTIMQRMRPVIFGSAILTSQKTRSPLKTNWLMGFKEIITVVRIMWNTDTLCGKNAQFLNVKAGGTFQIWCATKNTSWLVTPKLQHILVFWGPCLHDNVNLYWYSASMCCHAWVCLYDFCGVFSKSTTSNVIIHKVA
jgi:hypothetical protein